MSWFKRLAIARSRWVYDGRTDAGRSRVENADAFRIAPGQGLLVVADGMGGHRGGAVASRCAVDAMVRHFPRDGGAGTPWKTTRTAHRLVDAVHLANHAVIDVANADRDLEGMGCTLVAGVVQGSVLHTCNVGDSRCYVANEARILQVSRDHSMAAELGGAAGAGEETRGPTRLRHVVTRALGYPMDAAPEYKKIALRREKRILLCSDGLWGLVGDAEIHRILMELPTPSSACDALIDRANRLGGTDNITAVVGFR